jgi:hypothetical protein
MPLMAQGSLRLAGWRLRAAHRLLRSPAGKFIRRAMARMLFEKPLDAIDVGDEAPLYEPRPWVKP